MENKRKEIRGIVNMEIKIEEILIDNSQIVALPKPMAGRILNISCLGMLFESRLDIPINIGFCLKLSIENNIIDIIARILRKEEHEENYHYGCEFLQLSEPDKQVIRKYIFKKEIENRRKQKGR